MRTCSNCGSEFGVSDVFCTNCGARQTPMESKGRLEHSSRSAAAGTFSDPATATVEVATERAGVHDAQRYSAPGVGTASASEKPAGEAHWPQQPNLAGIPSGLPAPSTASTRAGETLEQKYLRQTRTATVFIAVIVGIVTVIALVGVIWTVTNVSNLNSQINGVNNNSNCESQGGTNPAC
jgi:cobalamin biosynthesis Mg chelatase CobN